ncbi:MAG: hypothetical protein ACKOPO_02470 [Novosphingobium sp.]
MQVRKPRRPRVQARLGRGLALAGCLAFAVLAIGSGMDRQAYLRPITARKVPALFADVALFTRGEAALTAGNASEANRFGEATVRRSPIDPTSTALLGAGRLALGDRLGADRAFRIAGQLGWRVPLTQAYWMQEAMAVKDWRVASERLDAILRAQPQLANVPELFAVIEASPDGRKAMVDRMAKARPAWLETYSFDLYDKPVDMVARRAAVLSEMSARGIILDCGSISGPVNVLARGGRMAEAQVLWRQHCRQPDSGLLADQSFSQLRAGDARSEFEWALQGNSDIGLLVTKGQTGGQIVRIEDGSAQARTLLRQRVLAGAGAYRIDWTAVDGAGAVSPRIDATLSCDRDAMPGIDAKAAASQRTVRIGGECAAPWLIVLIKPGVGEVNLSRVALSRL